MEEESMYIASPEEVSAASSPAVQSVPSDFEVSQASIRTSDVPLSQASMLESEFETSYDLLPFNNPASHQSGSFGPDEPFNLNPVSVSNKLIVVFDAPTREVLLKGNTPYS
jgi:hypothetical protein